MKRFLIISGLLLLGISVLTAQTKIIKGTITSASWEEPIPGVTVQAKGTTLGTVTDQNGKYSITVPEMTTTLVFSFTGMKKQEIEISDRAIIDVIMEYDIIGLEEVIVTTGYDIKRTQRSSSTLDQVVDGDKLAENRPIDINSALSGKVTGIQFKGQSAAKLGNQGYIRLRGGSGFGATSMVIYVVDGTIIPNPSDVNIDDIENISILSGPAASAILGSQGAEGAIIISTKKAKLKEGKSMGVEFNSGFQSSSVYILPNYQNDYGGGNVYDMYRYTYRETDPEEWKTLDGKFYPNYSDDASWGPKMVGQEYIPWYAWYPGTKYSGKTAKLNPQPENIRYFFESGLSFINNITFDKTGEDYNIRMILGNITASGNLPETSMGKNTFTVRTAYNISKKLTVNANINFSLTSTNGNFNDAYMNQATGTFNQWFHRDLDMSIMKELRGLRSPIGTLATWNHNDPASYTPEDPVLFYGYQYWPNPYVFRDFQKEYTRSDNLFGDVFFKYKIIKDLDFKITYRRQQNNDRGEVKRYSDLDESNNYASYWPYFGQYRNSTGYSIRENFETLLSFEKKFEKVSVSADAGSDFFNSSSQVYISSTTDGLNVRNLFAISNSKGQPSITETRSDEKYRALFIRGDIGFRNLLFGEFTLRNDWFSTLPEVNNSVLSKSIGLSLVFSDLLNQPWLSYGKLRTSWGEIPTAINAYVYPGTTYSVEQFQWENNFVMKTPDELVDPNIRGAVKTQKEIGLDIRFLKNMAGINLTYWDGTEKGIPFKVSMPSYIGFSSVYLNTGKIIKQGIDVSLSFKPLSMNNLSWDLSGTCSWIIKNEVDFIADGVDNFVVQGVFGLNLVHAKGYRWGQLFGSGMQMYNGKPELTPEGYYIQDPAKYFGSVIPDFTGGIQSSFRVMKNFTINASIDYQIGGKFWSVSEYWGTFSGLTARTSGVNDRGITIRDPIADGGGVHIFGVDAVTHEDVDYYIDAQTYFHNYVNLGIHDPFIYDLTYIKFRELTIGYDIPVNKIGNLVKSIQGANLSFFANNFWLIYAVSRDFDPSEVTYSYGERGQLPGIRSFGVNLKLNF